ncbi:MAG: alpha/beta hydrolase fold domain-containing protein [Planctomycetota bacterium]|jgi:acetyl esterase/lipase|nr:alpha/beta hydrolase fold domain-containing protein [Planctomycetota bacterium]
MKPEAMMKPLSILMLTASCVMRPQPAAARPQNVDVHVLEHISYGAEAPQAQVLNAYLVQRETPTAAIVQIVSGGWNSAPPRAPNLEPFTPYFEAGIAVIVAAHRPIGPEIHWPDPGNDIARAIQFVRSRADQWGIDPNRIAVKGRSSGGHLALMVGFGPDRANRASTDPMARQSSKPNCIVAGAAPTDLVLQMSELLKDSGRQVPLWTTVANLVGVTPAEISRDELLTKLKPLSPIEYATRDSPPVFLTSQGPADAFWPGDTWLKWDVHTPITSLILEKKLRELQVPCELVISPENRRSDSTLQRRELAFLARHLHLTAGQQEQSKPPVGEASHYSLGAKLEPPAGRVVHGMGQWEQYNAMLLPLLPAELRPASKLIFINIGDTPRGWRPDGIRNLIQRYGQEGFIPHIDIALRGNQPSHATLAAMADPLFGIDHEVAATSRFDGRIQDLVRIIKEFDKPVMVRIGGEFNGRWNGYHPYAYPRAFRKIVDLFRAAGADNAAFVWCYEPAAPGDFDEQNDAGEYKWFPGDDVIDWYAIDWFNRDDFTGPLTGGRPGQNTLTPHGRSRKFLDMAVIHHKPVMVAESAPCRYDLSDPAQAEAAWREWFEPYFTIIARRSEIKWFHLISYDWSCASYFAQTGWKNNDFTVSPLLMERLVAELRKPQYLHAGDKALLKDYDRFAAVSPASSSGRVRGEGLSRARTVAPEPLRMSRDKQAELAKFDEPAAHLPTRGPGGTEWDSQYRSLIQSDESAVSKGFPTHAEAAQQIKADAASDPANLQKHKGWVLFIKHYSQAYRPVEATDALRKLYQDLVEIEFGGSATGPNLPFAGDPRLTIHRDVVYGKTRPDIQRLDAYLTKSARPTPVVMEIHGGGWRRGARSQFTYRGDLIEAILDAGTSVVSIDYRLTPTYTLPAQMEDTVRAVQLVRSKAEDWNIDPNRVAAIGGSAGAHLAAWVGLHDDLARPDSSDPLERFSSRLICFVALAGPMDLTRVDLHTLAGAGARGESFAEAFTAAVGATPEQFMTDPETRRRLREASPLFLVSADDPPALIVAAGPAETALVPPTVPATINDPHSAWQGALLADALRRAGARVETRLGPKVGREPQADTAAVVDFLKRCLSATRL